MVSGSLSFEHYAREYEFWNFEGGKKEEKQKTLSSVLTRGGVPQTPLWSGYYHRMRQTIPNRKKYSSGHHCMSGIYNIEHYVMTW